MPGSAAMVLGEMPAHHTSQSKQKPPYVFLLEALEPLNPEVKPMFSGFAVYIGDKVVCMLRDRPKLSEDNGVWLVLSESFNPDDATSRRTLQREFPSLRAIGLLGNKIRHWLLVPSDGPDFETEALHACDLLLKRDARLGRIPQSRIAKSKPSKPNTPKSVARESETAEAKIPKAQTPSQPRKNLGGRT